MQYRPTQAVVDLDAIRANYEAFRLHLDPSTLLLACVKANAYGHGAVEVSREMERLGADYLSVAFLDEALELRDAGISLPILVLGYTPPEGLSVARDRGVTVALFSDEVLEAAKRLERGPSIPRLKVHIKADSGMGRLGQMAGADATAFTEKALEVETIEVEGLFTHFARADEADKTYTLEQYEAFRSTQDALAQKGIDIPLIHTGNSAAAIDTPGLSCNMVRIGIALYGLYPSCEVNRSAVALRPALTLKTQTVFVKTLKSPMGISYGSLYTAEAGERIATLPIGYADGYSRMLGGKAEVLIRGRRAPVTGTICMDQCMVTLKSFADAEDIQEGEEVVLLGSQSGVVITADEIAAKLGTIHYEVVCMLAHRVPRIYVRNHAVIAEINPLLHENSSAFPILSEEL
ncbi:alanine racemase [Saccharibacillus sp. CPCC 101409]|uniref:alanine racemase n=1 Tax=Saccharibacillus sp. CPCC 101409 TaxID=3058041 RepID=UPI0026726A06|nr:alanine racemase [Saccharibacillus sp. CPCC 101409]MDO3408610.1 alanine racemase [Saccharibacillus sp. CPCC 101409]